MSERAVPKLLQIALKARELSDYNKSIEILQEIISIDPSFPDAYILLGLNYMNTARLVIAIGYYKIYLRLRPNDPYAWQLTGFCILKYTEYTSSIPYLKKAISLGSNDRNIFVLLGEALFRSKKYQGSQRCLLHAHSLDGLCDKKRLYDFLFRSIHQDISQREFKYDYREALVESIKEEASVKTIICVGDSHVLNLEAVSGLVVQQTGSPTAFNLSNPASSSRALQQIQSLVSQFDPSSTLVVLTYGEIDVRVHIYKQFLITSNPIHNICQSVVDSLIKVAIMLKGLGYRVMINGPFGSGNGVPRYGEAKDRNFIAVLLDSLICEAASKLQIYYSSLVDIIVSSSFRLSSSFFGNVDENHLDKTYSISILILAQMLRCVKSQGIRKPYLVPAVSTSKKLLAFAAFMFPEGNISQAQIFYSDGATISLSKDQSVPSNIILLSLDGHYKLTNFHLSILNNYSAAPSIDISLYDANFTPLDSFCNCLPCSDESRDISYSLSVTHSIAWYIIIKFSKKIRLQRLLSLDLEAEYTSLC